MIKMNRSDAAWWEVGAPEDLQVTDEQQSAAISNQQPRKQLWMEPSSQQDGQIQCQQQEKEYYEALTSVSFQGQNGIIAPSDPPFSRTVDIRVLQTSNAAHSRAPSQNYEMDPFILFNPCSEGTVTPSPPPSFDVASALAPQARVSHTKQCCCDEQGDPFILDLPSANSVSTTPFEAGNTHSPIKILLESPSTLRIHEVCKLYSQTESVVARTVQEDPQGVSRRLPRTRAFYLKKRKLAECDYPINIAIQHNATLPVLKLLADAGPDVLVDGDGPEWCSALSFALYKRRGIDVVSSLLNANGDQVRVRDRHKNYPLHIACGCGSSLPIIKLLASRYRRALRKSNFHGLTPLDLAKRSSFSSDKVIDYLQEASFGSLEENVIHLEDMVEGDEDGNEESSDFDLF